MMNQTGISFLISMIILPAKRLFIITTLCHASYGQNIDEYEKCFWKIQSLEHDSVFRHFKYLTHASLELQMTALLECGNCYFKLRDYNSAIIRYEYAKQAFLDFMSDSNNDLFILSKENLSNYILNSLLLQIELGIARCYVAQKRYFAAHSIYYG